jgi:hypothetical protein
MDPKLHTPPYTASAVDLASAAERVAAGVALLDQKRPGWDAEVDLTLLLLASCDRCVLGQLYGDYSRATDVFDEDDYPEQYGFDLFEGDPLTYEDLTAEWKRVITERRQAVAR